LWWGGTLRASTKAGATATYRFTGRSAAWVSDTGPTRGKAQVYVDGVLRKTVDLRAATAHARQVVWSIAFSSSRTHTLKIKVLGTPGRPRVDVDGFLVGS
jgi:hypothetical protein